MSGSAFPTRTLLFISLALNLVIIGAVIGVVISGARLHRAAPPGWAAGPRAFMGALPDERSRAVRARLEAAWGDSKAERDAARDARAALLNVISQDKFDEAAVRAALAKMREADDALTAKNQDAVIGVLKDLPPRERIAALGAILRARGPGGMGPRPFRAGRDRAGMMGRPAPGDGGGPPP
jgi:uncharacterized membrane protein